MNLSTILLIGGGVFAAYNVFILWLALGQKSISRIVFLGSYAPWLLLFKPFVQWVYTA